MSSKGVFILQVYFSLGMTVQENKGGWYSIKMIVRSWCAIICRNLISLLGNLEENQHGVGEREETMNESGGQKTLKPKSHFSADLSSSAYSFTVGFRNEKRRQREGMKEKRFER